jgi:hypothetical protein
MTNLNNASNVLASKITFGPLTSTVWAATKTSIHEGVETTTQFLFSSDVQFYDANEPLAVKTTFLVEDCGAIITDFGFSTDVFDILRSGTIRSRINGMWYVGQADAMAEYANLYPAVNSDIQLFAESVFAYLETGATEAVDDIVIRDLIKYAKEYTELCQAQAIESGHIQIAA